MTSPSNPVSDQIAAVWRGLLAQMTAQGASRADIATLALLTADTILSLTADNLWHPDASASGTDWRDKEYIAPDGEREVLTAFNDITSDIELMLHGTAEGDAPS